MVGGGVHGAVASGRDEDVGSELVGASDLVGHGSSADGQELGAHAMSTERPAQPSDLPFKVAVRRGPRVFVDQDDGVQGQENGWEEGGTRRGAAARVGGRLALGDDA
jgi:hypothetical protein